MKKRIIMLSAVMLSTLTVASASYSEDPTTIEKIRGYVSEKYPKCVITEVEVNNNHSASNIEVEFVHNSKEKEAIFDMAGNWQSTKYDILKSELPNAVSTALSKSQYSDYSIDDIDVLETPDAVLYEIELEKWFSDDVTIFIDNDGKIR